jgi:type IV secretion system protein VirB10
VIDTSDPGAATAGSEGVRSPAAAPGGPGVAARTHASTLANRATTVAQGTLIPAVLETAFDSTRPGFARAIVSRDVRGFDGSRVLVPRGSRLVGEYRSDASPGQKRALINWTRLVRPDGVMIALDSPAVDTLGRGGIRASVDSHFFERFGDALLQTTVELGRSLAMRPAGDSVIVAVPGSVQSSAQPVQPRTIAPTLKVAAGRSISIFVARDLDFGREDGRR